MDYLIKKHYPEENYFSETYLKLREKYLLSAPANKQQLLRDSPTSRMCECSRNMSSSKYEFMFHLVNSAGEGRMLLKAKDFNIEKQNREQLDQTLYERVSESLGYKENKTQFRTLAKRVPFSIIKKITENSDSQEKIYIIQSLLFGVSGLLPENEKNFDTETLGYLAQLRKFWSIYKNKLPKNITMEKSQWKFSRIRHLNYPARRIAGFSYLIYDFLQQGISNIFLSWMTKMRHKLCAGNKKLSLTDIEEFSEIFVQPAKGYFANRAKFGSDVFSKPHVLIGQERARTMVINILVPFSLAYARSNKDAQLESAICSFYRSFPLINKNKYSKMFCKRLFGNTRGRIFQFERANQGLLQMFSDFCMTETDNCRKCALPEIQKLTPEELPV